ncbi:MAG: Verru_Chthon cassette protein A [Candidatus Methylacidiphilales bacterium]
MANPFISAKGACRQRRGFALVLVLIAITTVATMAVFFLLSAGRERRGVDVYARGSEVRHLAGVSVNRVIGQISAATKEGTAANPVSWASQPGMLRTFGTDGNLKNAYKLYSWDNMVEPGAGFSPFAPTELPPADWKSSPAAFTDLNQPVNDVYPIMDPRASGVVEGFSIDSSDVAVSGSGLAAPMPVKWLYVLEDGQMVAGTGGAGSTVTVTGATASNPVVGRVAFWADDETAKVNVNTASEGAYWDWPKAATYDEMQFAGNPPVGGEFNRTPGHPAMTSLSSVFPEMDPQQRWDDVATYRTKLSAMLGITPRIPYSDASSRGGTYPIETPNYSYNVSSPLASVPNTALPLKSDRLFVSPDELLFGYPTRTQLTTVSAKTVQQRAFFLTSSSRAPETTLFDTPRISLWPVTWPYPSAHSLATNRQVAPVSTGTPNSSPISANPWMRAEERLLAFVSTLNKSRANGGDRYFFQRQNPESPVYDFASITRNRDLLSYLQTLTGRQIPGYGGDFATKLTPLVRDYVLANTLNLVRSLVNQYTLQSDGKMLYSFTPISFTKFLRASGGTSAARLESGAFCPIPLKIDLGTGPLVTLSEFPQLRQAAMVFYATQRDNPVPPVVPGGASVIDTNKLRSNPWNWQNLINLDATNGYPVGARTTQMQAVMLLDFAPLRGSTHNNQPVFWVKIQGGSMSAAGQSLGFGNAVAKMDYQAAGSGRGVPGFLLPMLQKSATGSPTAIKTFVRGDVSNTNYGLISLPVSLNPGDTLFNFSGGSLTIEVYGIKDGNPDLDPTSDPSLMIASYPIDFSTWNGSHGIPLAPRWTYYDIKDETPQLFPNPNFQAFDASKPTKWAVMEIAPGYRTASGNTDPAMTSSYQSIWAYSGLYPTDLTKGGCIKVPTTTTLFGKTVTYVYRDSAGERMTDISKRVSFIPGIISATISNAENGTGRALNGSGDGIFNSGFPVITPYDTVLSMVPDPMGPGDGDPRLAQKFQFIRVDNALSTGALLRQVMPIKDYPRINKQYHTMGSANQEPASTGYFSSTEYSLLGKDLAPSGMAMIGASSHSGRLGWPGLSTSDSDAVGVITAKPQFMLGNNDSVGDWTSQPGYLPDGGTVNRADQDAQALAANGSGYQTPYFRSTNSMEDGLDSAAAKGYFSPNRQIPSPISLFGCLPSSLTQGWQTLVFCPNPARGATHPGLSTPEDFLLLDLFWMPVAEPYAISEEFSTAGKINLNYKIMPFGYINRRTGLHALMKSTMITAVSSSLAKDYKCHDSVKDMADSKTRYQIDVKETVDRIDGALFEHGDIFRSAGQICQMWLVPRGSTATNVEAFWNDKKLTSDTAREAPYDHLYSRVTTKSNTFTVHWRVQVLKKAPGTPPDVWNEKLDRSLSELRGSTLIERYLDPNSTTIPDYATNPSAAPLSQFYKWRVVSESYFQP